ncbi:hypothetical protein MASR2M48_04700 [Spirochaetota bacterium]
MKARLFILTVALAVAISIVGAQSPARIVMGGKAVTMVADAVYAFPSARDKIVAVGGTDQGLGVFLETVVPGFSTLPSFDRQAGAEVYASFKPDLIILKSSLKKSLGVSLETLGLKTSYVSLETPEDYYAELAMLGTLFSDDSRAGSLIGYYKGVVAKARQAAGKTAVVAPRVLLAQATADGFTVPPDSWMQTLLVELAGGVPVWKGSNPGSGWATVGAEQINAWNPDIFVIVSYKSSASDIAAKTAVDPRYAGLKAARNGRIVGFAQDFLSWDQPDTRWGLGLLWLTDVIKPGSMPGFSAEAEARNFYRLFYGINDASFDSVVKPRMSGLGK